MININENTVRITGTLKEIEMEAGLILISLYDKEPESINTILHFLQAYMDNKITIRKVEVEDDQRASEGFGT